MTERPILFSGPMVRAILAGRKTQTRRVVKLNPRVSVSFSEHLLEQGVLPVCPYGVPGDRLWVRETFAWNDPEFEEQDREDAVGRPQDPDGRWCWYRATDGEIDGPWTPSIHMPRWASRLTLGVKAVRVERLQDINEDDAKAEGVEAYASIGPDQRVPGPGFNRALLRDQPHRLPFADFWRSINGEDAWEQNPWVWVVEFEVLK